MIVVRFKVQCQPEKTEQVMAAFEGVIAPSRAVDGVISFDIARDLADPRLVHCRRGVRGSGSARASGIVAGGREDTRRP